MRAQLLLPRHAATRTKERRDEVKQHAMCTSELQSELRLKVDFFLD
jgi:hypothetical protein